MRNGCFAGLDRDGWGGLRLLPGAAVLIAPLSPEDKKPTPLKSTNYPDLIVQSMAIAKTECKGGRPFVTASATIKNVSTKHAANLSQVPFQTVLKLGIGGGNAQTCPGVVQFNPGSPLQIAPGVSWTGSTSLCIPPGGYYVTAIADPLNAVKEIQENNNYQALPIPGLNPCK